MSKKQFLEKYSDRKLRLAMAKERIKKSKEEYQKQRLEEAGFSSKRQKKAKDAGYVDKDGNPDLKAHWKCIKEGIA